MTNENCVSGTAPYVCVCVVGNEALVAGLATCLEKPLVPTQYAPDIVVLLLPAVMQGMSTEEYSVLRQAQETWEKGRWTTKPALVVCIDQPVQGGGDGRRTRRSLRDMGVVEYEQGGHVPVFDTCFAKKEGADALKEQVELEAESVHYRQGLVRCVRYFDGTGLYGQSPKGT